MPGVIHSGQREAMTNTKKKIEKLGLVLLISMIIIITLIIVETRLNFKLLVVQSGSMTPTISVGSLVLAAPEKDYQLNDIVAFIPPTSNSYDSNQTLITHRIIKQYKSENVTMFVTKGDANNNQDMNALNEELIVGKVKYSFAGLGYAVDFIKSTPGFLLIVVLPCLIIIILEIKNIYKELLKRKLQKHTNYRQLSFCSVLILFVIFETAFLALNSEKALARFSSSKVLKASASVTLAHNCQGNYHKHDKDWEHGHQHDENVNEYDFGQSHEKDESCNNNDPDINQKKKKQREDKIKQFCSSH